MAIGTACSDFECSEVVRAYPIELESRTLFYAMKATTVLDKPSVERSTKFGTFI